MSKEIEEIKKKESDVDFLLNGELDEITERYYMGKKVAFNDCKILISKIENDTLKIKRQTHHIEVLKTENNTQQQKIEQLEKEIEIKRVTIVGYEVIEANLKKRVKELEGEIKSKWDGYCQKETLKGERCNSIYNKVQCGY